MIEKRKVYEPRPNQKMWQGDHTIRCFEYEKIMDDIESLYKFLVSKFRMTKR